MKHPGAIWKELLANASHKPATVLYPKERLELPPNFRGRPVFHPEKCIGCMLCTKDCPSRAVEINKIAEKTYSCTFHLGRCIYCGQCADSCNKDAITMSHIYELAAFEQQSMNDTTKGEPKTPTAASEPAAG